VLAPDDVGARYALAEALFAEGQMDAAVKCLERALAIAPDHGDARRLLARAFQREGRLVPAERTLEEAVRRRPDDAGARDELAGLLVGGGRVDDAIVHLEEARRVEPDDVARLSLLADLAQRSGLFERARRHLERARALAPDDGLIAGRLHDLALKMGDAGPAPKVAGGLDFLLDRALAALASPPLRDAARAGALRAAAAALAGRDVAGAKRALVTASPVEQATAAFEAVRAEIVLLEGDAEKAARAFHRCTERAPELALGWSRLGELALAAGRAGEAVACLERAALLAPADAEARERLGDALSSAGRRDEAIARYREALAARPDGALAARIAALSARDPGRDDATLPGRIGALGWSATGGTVSPVEAAAPPGKGELIFTGNVGKAGQDAARVAFSCLKARADALGIADRIERCDLHLHFVDTELQKDGPSAGLALALAGLSAYARAPLRPRLAATGELTLHGAVRPVGGLHEKLVAAYLADVAVVIVPRRNLFELKTVPSEVVARLEIAYVDSLPEALEHARGTEQG